ncbi:DUF2274 domain-containing protein [Novosphingobium sp. JCM 18896]|uniref:DUF2274 domain-containing protein n=1 Tax=Novosphingobium sp. JCM 18896 TaxID=2989731 RepID=UPI002223606E|nr:DUF2274 domain-containing protein [Novosphingobium sp. JCM 18896]MCW1430918.1 DUF2274 domain-containing protein [Novosphingobium sp. JCM 18896]
MSQIRLAKLPDRTPVRLNVSLSPELAATLGRYAEFYRAAYGSEETVADLLPAIVAAFLDGDKAFGRWCRDLADRPT